MGKQIREVTLMERIIRQAVLVLAVVGLVAIAVVVFVPQIPHLT